jgi:hypothetical protein
MARYSLRDETGYEFSVVEAESGEAALDATDDPDAVSYGVDESTIWVRYRAVNCDDDDDTSTRTYRIDPPAPKCCARSHCFQTPHEIVGGLKENPGVWGHGGGVIIREVCMHCGCERTTDTWAHDRSTGEQGLESIAYAPGKYADEVTAMQSRDDDKRAEQP